MSQAVVYRAPGERETCPTCGSRRLYELDVLLVRLPRGRHTGFVSGCDDCGLVFSNPLPTADELRDFYSHAGAWRAGRDEAGAAEDSGAANRGGSWSRPFSPIERELSVTNPPAGASVLDFGCGTGKLLDALQACGWQTWGIEPAVDTPFRRHRRLESVPGEPTFDLIVANHVLEHVTDPLALLRQFARASRPGGYLYVGVPRFDTLPIHRDYKYVINGRAHLIAYTWPCLQGLLGRAGWEPVALPPDRVAKGGGRTTCSRLQVIARRSDAPAVLPAAPARAARTAMGQYHSQTQGRSLVERLGLFRLAARRIEAQRRRAKTLSKSAKIRAAIS
jgi:SAM-dependent methyltransferase